MLTTFIFIEGESRMDNRSRIINTVLCKNVDRLPFFFYFGPWHETVERWKEEGLKDEDWSRIFDFDQGFNIVDVKLGYSPPFVYKELEDKGNTLIVRDQFGITQEIRKGGSSIPYYIDYPVKGWEDWEKLKRERLDPNDPQRFPSDWKELVTKYNNGDQVIQLGAYPFGLFGTLRDMMGVERLLVSFYDVPDLIHDMMDYLTDFWIAIYEKVCKDVNVNAIHMWEDMSGKNGSLISPHMVRKFMVPNYQKIKAFADDHNIPIFSLDTDGDCTELIPLYLDSGINLVFPFEVAAGCNIIDLREQYPNLCIMGGIDKQEIAKGHEAIDRELSRVDKVFQQTGYIPALDHLIHPEISWSDFQYFVKKLRELIGVDSRY